MMADRFTIGHTYTRQSVFQILSIDPVPIGGNWFTGYHCHEGAFFLFVTVGAAGRTGHDYQNRWLENGLFEWYGKEGKTLDQPEAKAMLEKGRVVHLFVREANRDPFVYHGAVTAEATFDEEPFRVHWRTRSR